MKGNVVIVVPIHKDKLNNFEEISLKQLFTILYNYDIIYVIPKGMNLQHILKIGKPNDVITFDVSFFESKKTYSRLLLSKDFYLNFTNYKYMLIYQLDAFVFKDELDYYSSMEYDYIGAPMPFCYWKGIVKRVGNGGFSLRKIDAILKLINNKNVVLRIALKKKGLAFCRRLLVDEDKFFGFAGSENDIDFQTAPLNMSYRFSLECDVANQFKRLDDELPFGCHRWYKDNFSFWEKYIVKFGYVFDENDKSETISDAYNNYRLYTIRKYLIKRIIKKKKNLFDYMLGKFFKNKKIVLWGYGSDGKEMEVFSRKLGIKIMCIYDNKFLEDTEYKRKPTKEELIKPNQIVVIGSRKYYRDMKKQLVSWGGERSYISLAEFYDTIINCNYHLCK